jgi:hypothetical protein
MQQLFQLLSKAIQSITQNGLVLSIISIVSAIIIAGIAIYLDWRNEQRSRDTFTIERRRITEVNLKVNYQLQIAPSQQTTLGDHAFMVLRLLLENSGDGPVDILGMLASARFLSGDYKQGTGNRGRDVEWGDYEPFYWDQQNLGESTLICGISTTKHIVSSGDDYIRLAAKETASLRRIDAVNNIEKMYEKQHATVLYRVFTVTRGYPLGEILRQLGGGPPDPSINVAPEQLQFQSLAQPDYYRWRTVQEALINLNRFVFRLALYQGHYEDSRDPLGFLANPNAWRIFLLHHWEFVDEATAAPAKFQSRRQNRDMVNFTRLIEDVSREIAGIYPDLVLPENWNPQDDRFIQATSICRKKLSHMVDRWVELRQVIEICSAYPTTPQKSESYADVGYAALIHHAPYFKEKLKNKLDYQERWLALMREGYLVSRPFRMRRRIAGLPLLWRRHRYGARDIPADPRSLEPYVIRTHYFLTSVAFPKKNEHNWKTIDL